MRWAALLLGLLAATPVAAENVLVGALRQGGLVLFLRHADTGYPWPDQSRAVIGDCETQRDLSEAGRTQSRRIGAAYATAGVPIGPVLASPFCRTMETAVLAFGAAGPEPALGLPRDTSDPAAHRAMGDALLALLQDRPPHGRNLVLVGHTYHLLAATGVRLEPQGATAVLRWEGPGRITVLGILPPDWGADRQFAERR